MPVDPQAKALIDAAAGMKPTEEMGLEEGRAALEERSRLTGLPPAPLAQVLDTTADGIPMRIYVPEGARPQAGLVFFHGGGWVRGSIQTHESVCRALANQAGCTVVSVEYRRAPEDRFPAAIDDAVAATRWVARQAQDLGIDPERLAVGGDSAGGNLAAATALVLRDQGGPPLRFQLLIYPVTDYNFETDSYLANAEGYLLTRSAMQYYWRQYLRDESDAQDVRASPLRAQNLAGLPPALVITAEFDPLRDEGRLYAERLQAAGVPTVLRDYAGMIHGFVSSAGAIDGGKQAIADAAAALREALSPVAAPVR